MKVVIIGAAGRMGGWLSRHFARLGDSVVLYDTREDEARKLARQIKQKATDDLRSALRGADAIFVSVPIEATTSVLRGLADHLSANQIVGEVSSLKSETARALVSLRGRCSTLLSLHPLFGPGIRTLKRKRIVWVPQTDPKREEAVARRLFPGATFVRATVEEHDRMMAITLGLTHFVNAVFAGIVEEEEVENLREFGGTSFALQLMVAQTVLRDNASLLASIQLGNRYGPEYVERFLTEATRLARLTKSDRKGTEQFFESVRERMRGDPKFELSYRKAYSLLESLLDA